MKISTPYQVTKEQVEEALSHMILGTTAAYVTGMPSYDEWLQSQYAQILISKYTHMYRSIYPDKHDLKLRVEKEMRRVYYIIPTIAKQYVNDQGVDEWDRIKHKVGL